MEIKRDSGSFRDNRGHVYLIDGKIYRTINRSAIEQYKDLIQKKIISKSINNNYLVNTTEVSNEIPNSNFKYPKRLKSFKPLKPFKSLKSLIS